MWFMTVEWEDEWEEHYFRVLNTRFSDTVLFTKKKPLLETKFKKLLVYNVVKKQTNKTVIGCI